MNALQAEHLHAEQQTVNANSHRESYKARSARRIHEAARADGMRPRAWMETQIAFFGYDWWQALLNTGVGNSLLWRACWRKMQRPFIKKGS